MIRWKDFRSRPILRHGQMRRRLQMKRSRYIEIERLRSPPRLVSCHLSHLACLPAMSEKTPLTLPTAQQWSASGESIPSTKPTRTKWRWAAPLLVSAWLITRAIPLSLLVEHPAIDFAALSKKGASCPSQPEPLLPKIPFKPSGGYRKGSAKLLSEAVVSRLLQVVQCSNAEVVAFQQIATESFDDNGLPTEDPRWAPFFDFQKWLVESFPLV